MDIFPDIIRLKLQIPTKYLGSTMHARLFAEIIIINNSRKNNRKKNAKEIIGSYLLAEIGSDFIFLLF
jgi:hypothetical protein